MKIQKIIILLLSGLLNLTCAAQDRERMFYKDTLFEFNGSKIEITKSLSTEKYFKSIVTISNQTDQFMIINPWEVFGKVSGSDEKYNASSKKAIVVPPKYIKKFTVKFEGRDFREERLQYDFGKIEVTEKIESVYELEDVDINKENYRAIGPIRWSMVKKMEPDHGKDDFQIIAEIEYTGDKFLGIFYNNIILTTKDGGKYINVGKKTGNFHYDKTKPFVKQTYLFPVEPAKAKKSNEPKLTFRDVFKEYSMATIVGFKVHLRAGTLEDYKGKAGKPDDKDIEEME